MKLSELRKAYKNLQYIIKDHHYLIPKPPTHPASYLVRVNKVLRKQNPSANLGNVASLTRNFKQTNLEESQKIKQEQKNQIQKYREDLKKYQEKYVDVLRLFKRNVYNEFIKEYFNQSKQQQKSLKKAAQLYAKLTPQQKQSLQAKIQQKKAQNLQKYQQFVNLHRIPQLKRTSVFGIYNAKAKNNETAKSSYSQLSLQQMYQITLQKDRINQQRKQKYETELKQFLQRWNLKASQLQNIKIICKQYDTLLRKNRSLKRNNEQESTSEDKSEDTSQSDSDEPHKEQNKKN